MDADGLKLLSRLPGWPADLPSPAVLTPHPGEMSVLTGLSKAEIQADRLGIARRYSQAWGHVVILKGAFTVIAEPGGEATVIPVANSGSGSRGQRGCFSRAGSRSARPGSGALSRCGCCGLDSRAGLDCERFYLSVTRLPYWLEIY